MNRQTIGFVGIGAMGTPMAGHLARAGYPLIIFDAGFATGLMAKDLRTALELARAVGAPAPLAKHRVELWNEMEQRLGAAADHTEMFRYLEGMADHKP